MGIWIGVLACLLVAAVIAIILQQRQIKTMKRRQHQAETLLDSLEEERPALAQMIRHIKDDEPRQLIQQRADLLGRLLAAGVSRDSGRSNAVLDEVDLLVAERTEFMRQTRLIYERMQPTMMEQLRECGLTDEECEICCLYALGLNGKEIQQYTKDGRHYQNVGLIRKKLGLGEHDRNIDGYIRSLLK